MMKRVFAAVALMSVLAGCSSTSQPMVDTKGVDSARYQQDNYECQQYANQVSPVGDAAVGAVGGAAAGAALGAITGALVGGVSAGSGAALGAATGGALGLGGGAVTGVQNQREVFRNCMRGRGYNVLN
jgi:outer membrane lipoprotein SlyB